MWLRTLVNEALADDTVGIVGGKFLYPNGSIQHGGVVLGIGGVAGHIHVGHRAEEGGYAGRAYFAQELSAVTAACMLVKAKTLQEVGGFDEVSLPVAFNDIDLCLKARTAGYRVVWTPEFVADHHESLSRGSDDRPQTRGRFFHETQTMMERWGQMIQHDPFYSKHFDLKGRPFYDLVDPRGSTDLEPISDSQKTLN
jgi:GT2 family glycosyltransferase